MKFMYLYFGVVIIFVIGYQIFMFTRANKRKKEVLEWLEKNPKAAKVYIKTNSSLLASMFTPSSIRLIAIDDDYPMTSFTEGFKQGFYLAPGKHKITSSLKKLDLDFSIRQLLLNMILLHKKLKQKQKKLISILLIKKMNNILLQK